MGVDRSDALCAAGLDHDRSDGRDLRLWADLQDVASVARMGRWPKLRWGVGVVVALAVPALAVPAVAVQPPPDNDDFERATWFTSEYEYQDGVWMDRATRAPDDPSCRPGTGPTVWYAFTAVQSGWVEAQVGGVYGSHGSVSVWTGQRGALQAVACEQPSVRFDAVAGRTYHLMVTLEGWTTEVERSLGLSVTSQHSRPVPRLPDDFDEPRPVLSLPYGLRW
jgi:hypothetical protein